MRDVRDNLQQRANVLEPSNATLAELSAPQRVTQTRRPAWLERAGAKLIPDHDMRDIRADLQERTKFLEEQIEASQAQFDTMFAQLKQDHKVKVDGLKKELDAVLVVIGFEDQRFGNTASSAQSTPQPSQSRQREASTPQSDMGHRADQRIRHGLFKPVMAVTRSQSALRAGLKERCGRVRTSPAMPNGRCRMHGGKSPGAPRPGRAFD